MKPICARISLAVVVTLLWTLDARAAPTLINFVPDWNQPYTYNAPGGPGPDPNAPGNDPYDNFCTPTAAANLFGYWEGVRGFTGLTDRQVFPVSPAWPNNQVAPTWQQGLWHDAVVELGYHLDTNDANPLNGNDGHLGTKLLMNAIGMANFGSTGWQDGNTLITKVAWQTTAWSVDWNNLPVNTTAWDDYVADINLGNPVLINFDYWNPIGGGQNPSYPAIDWFYNWGNNPGGSLGHTVTGVGYLDVDGNNNTDNDKWWIVHDNWNTTPTTIAIPYWDAVGGSAYNWQQNDHVFVPEPATLVLLACGLVGILGRTRIRRR